MIDGIERPVPRNLSAGALAFRPNDRRLAYFGTDDRGKWRAIMVASAQSMMV